MQIDIQGESIDLGHLAPIVRAVDLDLRGNLRKRNARVGFRFSCHCYSRRPRNDEVIPDEMRVRDGSAQNPRDRIFCRERYALSLHLVAHLDALIAGNGMVQKSRHLNFFATRLVTAGQADEPVERTYYIFMDATKKQDPNQPPRIDVFVESAYLANPVIPGPSTRGDPLPLSEMLGQVWENQRR